MTDEQIYELWFSRTQDLRYLRPRRWSELRSLIESRKLKSVIEFGSGVSTLLFDNMELEVLSLETSKKFMSMVQSLCTPRIQFKLWDNKHVNIIRPYHLALVDGILPRDHQLQIALKLAKIVAIDDFEGDMKQAFLPKLSKHKRIDTRTTTLAIFDRNSN